MSEKIFSHEAMMREIAARDELRLAEHRFIRPEPETPFTTLEEFDAFVGRWRRRYHATPRVH